MQLKRSVTKSEAQRQTVRSYICPCHAYELFKETHTDYSDSSVLRVPMCGKLLCVHAVRLTGLLSAGSPFLRIKD